MFLFPVFSIIVHKFCEDMILIRFEVFQIAIKCEWNSFFWLSQFLLITLKEISLYYFSKVLQMLILINQEGLRPRQMHFNFFFNYLFSYNFSSIQYLQVYFIYSQLPPTYQNYKLSLYKNKMKTISHFYTPEKKHHTQGSEHSILTESPGSKRKEKLRIRNVTSMTQNHNTKQTYKSYIQDTPLNLKSPRPIDRYDQESQNLTTQFSAQWLKMSSNKRETYSKLRNKFVRKFPSFREKYKQQEIEQLVPETQQQIRHTQIKTQISLRRPSIEISLLSSITKIKPVDPLKKAYFYSRSKKKCLQNTVQVKQIKQYMKEVYVPKISYINYVKSHKQRKKLYVNKVKGNNMIKSRDKILCLQKQGTKSYHSLKKCLEDAIQTCITGKTGK